MTETIGARGAGQTDHHDRRTADRRTADRRTAMREQRAAQTAHGLTTLLARRPELATACPLAAFAVDAVRWSA